MFRIMIIALLMSAQTDTASASTTCAGADPAIASVVVKGAHSGGGLNRYQLSGTIVNVGRAAQPSNTLQFVDIYKGSEKLDSKGIPPLNSGQSYTFSYVSVRSSDAGKGTTSLTFRLDVRQASQDCSTSNDRYTVTF